MTNGIEKIDHVGELYTVEAAGRALGVSKRSALYRVWRYGLPVKRLGHVDLIRLEDLRATYETLGDGAERPKFCDVEL
jgi:hypothetical protein